jgi:NAD(P)-dependent dehydrogenase (short-subunit alcohol dehydrogenase family)
MARVFITGSSQGLGLMAAQILAKDGHHVTLHARNEERARDAVTKLPATEAMVIGDVSTLDGIRNVAAQAAAVGRFDAVIHNVAVGDREPRRIETADGLSQLFAVNVLAPYLLTALLPRPDRLVYLSSGLHLRVTPDLTDLQWTRRRWNGPVAYSESKFMDVQLALAMARRWPHVRSNAVEPGWVATRMGGPNAPGDLAAGPVTQAWLAVSDDDDAAATGEYFFHQRRSPTNPAVHDVALQEELLRRCAELTGTELPT